jgi:hypothetical protein
VGGEDKAAVAEMQNLLHTHNEPYMLCTEGGSRSPPHSASTSPTSSFLQAPSPTTTHAHAGAASALNDLRSSFIVVCTRSHLLRDGAWGEREVGPRLPPRTRLQRGERRRLDL